MVLPSSFVHYMAWKKEKGRRPSRYRVCFNPMSPIWLPR
jgi:hypothetical protein